jgi:H+/Cl- antiporter ClcA
MLIKSLNGETMASKYNIWERIIDKLMSARFVIVVSIAGTLCLAVLQSFRIVTLDCVDKETLMFRKEVFMYVMGVFSGIAGSVISSYFQRHDRVNKDNSTDELNKP